MIRYVYQQGTENERRRPMKKVKRCCTERKLIRCLHCKKKEEQEGEAGESESERESAAVAVLVVRILECVHSLYSLISW